jgi:hypothetical protein
LFHSLLLKQSFTANTFAKMRSLEGASIVDLS